MAKPYFFDEKGFRKGDCAGGPHNLSLETRASTQDIAACLPQEDSCSCEDSRSRAAHRASGQQSTASCLLAY